MRAVGAVGLVVLLAGCWPRAAGAQGLSFPAGPTGSVWIWEPDKSAEDGVQADPRLDKQVEFWRAGLTLAEVFASVKEQTGVEIAFWPPDDLDTRVRVNLYLNPKQPPSLRSLMVELVWVTECVFTFADRPAGRVYYLLSTATTADARAKMTIAEVATAPERRDAEIRAQYEGELKQILARTQVYERALRLTRDELIRQYKDRDNRMLYNLLDPKRRAGIGLVCRLPMGERETLLRNRSSTVTRDLKEWDAESRALLDIMFSGDPRWFSGQRILIEVSTLDGMTGIVAQAPLPTMEQNPVDWESVGAGAGWFWREDRDLQPWEEIPFRRLLGEQISSSEEKAYVEQGNAALLAENTERQRAQEQERWASSRSLSEEAMARLSGAHVPFHFPDFYMLWEIQEAAAQATGLSVISDSFCDMPRRVAQPGEPWTNDTSAKDTPLNALEALSAACAAELGRDDLLSQWDNTCVVCLGWEWGDAGDVLRFRSLYRDIWRASFLPTDVVKRMDGWVMPFLTPEAMARGPMRIPVDPYEVLWVAGQLDTSQERYGKFLSYGDPADEKERWLRELQYCAVNEISWKPIYKLLSTLTPKQWELARGDGIRMGYDLSSSQRAMASESLPKLAWTGPLKGKLEDFTMRVRPGEPKYVRDLHLSDKSTWHVEFVANGKLAGEAMILEELFGYVTKTGRDKALEAKGRGRPVETAH
jgi:hypothetical protein